MPAGPVPASWLRYLRVSVRGLIVLVLVIGAGMGWLVRSARIQREAVAAIRNAGHHVVYNWEWSDEKGVPPAGLWMPRWFVDHIGVDYFGHVASVWFNPTVAANDVALAQAERFPGLTSSLECSLRHCPATPTWK